MRKLLPSSFFKVFMFGASSVSEFDGLSDIVLCICGMMSTSFMHFWKTL